MFCEIHRQMTLGCDSCGDFSCGKCDDPGCDMDCCDHCAHAERRLRWRHWASDFWQRFVLRRNGLLRPDRLRDWAAYLWLWARRDRR